jgi:hypothetical protein
VADPFAGLAAPGVSGTPQSVSLAGNAALTIKPGVYSQIKVSGNARLTLLPGVYVIAGGGFTVGGNGSVTGTGVLIYNAGSGYAYNPGTGVVSDGGTFGSISLSGNGTISLSAPATGQPYAGVVIFQSRGNSRPLSLSGNGAAGLTGTVHAPAAAAGLSGNAQLTGTLIVSTLSLTGNAGAFQLADGTSSGYAVSTSNWITNGVLTVAAQDDTGNGLDPNEVARLGDAMAYLNQALGSFGVYLSWAAPDTSADVTVHFASTMPEGSAGDGVLGFTTAANDVYLVTGWSFYTGLDPTGIGANQFDFLTLSTHELAHTLGLGESSDPNSVMYEYLAPGTVRRTFTDDNLARIDTNADRFMKLGGGPGQAPGEPAGRPTDVSAFPEALAQAPNPRPAHAPPAAFGPVGTGRAFVGPMGGGYDVLVGGAGDDLTIGDRGRDVPVGGIGRTGRAEKSGDHRPLGDRAVSSPDNGGVPDQVHRGDGNAAMRHAGADAGDALPAGSLEWLDSLFRRRRQ